MSSKKRSASTESFAPRRSTASAERGEVEALDQSELTYRQLFEQHLNPMWIYDPHTLRFLVVNEAAIAHYGYSREEFLAMTIADIRPSEDVGRLLAQHHAPPSDVRFRGAWRHRKRDGTIIDVEITVCAVIWHGATAWAAMVDDVTERMEARRNLEYLAHHDALTSLPNRRELQRVLQDRLAELESTGGELAVAFVDLEGFAPFNNMFGHARGDELLITISDRLRSRLDATDFLCRWGGDEFVIVFSADGGRTNVGKKVEFVLESLDRPFLVDDRTYNIDASAGISLAPIHGMDVEGLLRAADSAMYRAKAQARGAVVIFDGRLHSSLRRRLSIESNLRTGLAGNELTVVYQPIWDARSSRIVAVEALLRWDSEALGTVSPEEFIPVAEEVGLMRSIGSWVLREACRQARQWHESGLEAIRVCVNISPSQLRFRGFAAHVRGILEETGIDPSLVELELTERVMLDAEPSTAATVRLLRSSGVRLSIDDFGTGYSSLRYLKMVEVDSVKIDRIFVKDMPEDDFSVAIARSIISLAHSLKMTVVAEGIETQAQRDLLQSLGCDQLQGFLFNRPLVAAECTRLLSCGGL